MRLMVMRLGRGAGRYCEKMHAQSFRTRCFLRYTGKIIKTLLAVICFAFIADELARFHIETPAVSQAYKSRILSSRRPLDSGSSAGYLRQGWPTAKPHMRASLSSSG